MGRKYLKYSHSLALRREHGAFGASEEQNMKETDVGESLLFIEWIDILMITTRYVIRNSF